jgi:transposase
VLRPAAARSARAQVVLEILRDLGPTHTNAQLAEHLNQAGHLTASGRPFDEDGVRWLRWQHRSRLPRRCATTRSASTTSPNASASATTSSTSGSGRASSRPAAPAAAASRSPSTTRSRPPAANGSPTPPAPATEANNPLQEVQNEGTVDEIAYRRGQRYLTTVADHRSGRIVWSAPGRNAQTLRGFFDALGDRRGSIRAVSIDMNGGYEKAIRAALPDAEVCFDPFHVVALAGRAVDDVRRAEWNAHAKSTRPKGQWLKGVRWALRKNPEHLTDRQRLALATVQQTNKRLYRAYLLKEQLRALYQLDDPAAAPEHLRAWLTWAERSQLRPFVKLARTLRARRDGILAAIQLGLTNSRLEDLHSKVRLLSHRSFGFHSPTPLIALIHLCAAGIEITLPSFTPNP